MLKNKLRVFNVLNVYAEGEGANNEGTITSGSTDYKPTGNVNYEDLIAKARQEEKNKLYPQINELKEKVNNYLIVIAEKDNKIKELEAKISEADSKVKIVEDKLAKAEEKHKSSASAKESELQAKIDSLENQLLIKDTEKETEIKALKLDSFKKEKIAEAGSEIIPELVTGNTEEEITASVEKAKARYKEIVGTNTSASAGAGQVPPANPNAATILKMDEMTPEAIRNMSAKDWAEKRKELGIK